jgi:hypothetical protein
MINNLQRKATVLLGTALFVLAACANQMEPAQKALAQIDSAIASAQPDAGKYIPDQLATVQAKLAELKADFDRKDYAAALAGTPALLTQAQALLGAAALKKDEVLKALGAEWTGLAATVPALVTSIGSRVQVIAAGRHSSVNVAAAKTGLADATSLWSKAQAAFASGNLEEAVNTAKEVRSKAEAVATTIGMKLPAHPAGN